MLTGCLGPILVRLREHPSVLDIRARQCGVVLAVVVAVPLASRARDLRSAKGKS